MAAALTVKAIEALRPSAARREVPDGLVPGLYFIVQPSGARSWAVRYRADGRTRKHTLGTFPAIDLKAAREKARAALVDVAKGGDPGAAKQATKVEAATDRDLVERVSDQFVERYAKARQRSWEETKRILDREVVKPWRGRHLGAITRSDVHELLDAIVDRGTPVMANRVLAALRKMCGWAVERGLIASSPCDKVRAPSAENSRDRVLTDAELRMLWGVTDKIGWPFGPLVRLLMLTAQRRDEVGQMRWSEVNLAAATWTLPRERVKNNQAHVVPLSAPALAILGALPKIEASLRTDENGKTVEPEDYVFTSNGYTAVSGFGKAKLRMDAAMATAGDGPLPHWVIHDLRRTAATGMARQGAALPVIERVLNHVSGSFGGIVGVYQRHGFEDEKRAALNDWGAFVERLGADPAG